MPPAKFLIYSESIDESGKLAVPEAKRSAAWLSFIYLLSLIFSNGGS